MLSPEADVYLGETTEKRFGLTNFDVKCKLNMTESGRLEYPGAVIAIGGQRTIAEERSVEFR